LLKSLRLGLEISLTLAIGFPFSLSRNIELETTSNFYARVAGIPSNL
jgi:CRISPR-associated protein Csc3